MKNFWFQVIDLQGGVKSDGTFVPVNWREEMIYSKQGYSLPETWKPYFPLKLQMNICGAESNSSGIFDGRFTWIKE